MMTITELQQRYATHSNVEAISGLLKDPSVRTLFCGGLCASAASLFSSVLVQRGEFPFVFILGDLEEAGYFYHDLTQILGTEKVLFFPSSFRRAIKYGQKDAANEILRTEVLSRLQKGEEGLCVVTYPDALAEKVVSRKELGDKTLLRKSCVAMVLSMWTMSMNRGSMLYVVVSLMYFLSLPNFHIV